MQLKKKKQLLQRRRWRVRKRLKGTPEKPRLSVYFSHKHMYAQCIDDTRGHTLVYLSTLGKNCKKLPLNVAGATEFGEIAGKTVSKTAIKQIVFDRGIRRYHGLTKAFAEAFIKELKNS